MKKAVITILGIQGGFVENDIANISNFSNKANYYFEKSNEKKEYFNIVPLLIDKYENDYEIVPIYTKEAKIFNQEVLNRYNQNGANYKLNFQDSCFIKDDKNFDEIFYLMHKTIESYDKVIVDVTHGFRHLPLLMLVELIMQNFSNTNKIEKILFAKEIVKYKSYEVIDLKRYAQLANISFILENFEKNYTVASHISSTLYTDLIKALNDFSNDLMALNLNNLFDKSVKKLKKELLKLNDISISTKAKNLYDHIDIKFKKANKRYLTYYNLSKELFEKKYMLLSLSLLNESLRLYIKTYLKKKHKTIVEKLEQAYSQDLYKIGDFFSKLVWMKYDKFERDFKRFRKRDNAPISKNEFNKLKRDFPYKVKEKFTIGSEKKNLIDHISHKRNNLAHANSSNVSFDTIKDDIGTLIKEFELRCINKPTAHDLIST